MHANSRSRRAPRTRADEPWVAAFVADARLREAAKSAAGFADAERRAIAEARAIWPRPLIGTDEENAEHDKFERALVEAARDEEARRQAAERRAREDRATPLRDDIVRWHRAAAVARASAALAAACAPRQTRTRAGRAKSAPRRATSSRAGAVLVTAGADGPPPPGPTPPGAPRLTAASVVTIDGRRVTEAELFAAVDLRRADASRARHANGRPRGRLTPGSAGAVALAVIAWDAAPGGEFTIADLMRAWEVAPAARGRCRLTRRRWRAVLASLTRGGWLERATGPESRWRVAPGRAGEFPGLSGTPVRAAIRAVGC